MNPPVPERVESLDHDNRVKLNLATDTDHSGGATSDDATSHPIDVFTYQDDQHCGDIFRTLNSYRLRNDFCDVTIIIPGKSVSEDSTTTGSSGGGNSGGNSEGDRFPAHKVILASISDYFNVMFNTQMLESNQKEICIQDIDIEAFRLLIDYAYTGTITFNCLNIESVLYAASILQIDKVITGCTEYLKKRLSIKNCIGIWCFAENHGHSDLKKAADSFLLEHFTQVFRESDEYMTAMTCEHLRQLISCNDLNVDSECIVLEAILAWIYTDDIDKEGRIKELPALIKYVRMEHLPIDYLLNKACQSKILRSDANIRDQLDACVRKRLAKSAKLTVEVVTPMQKQRPRNSYAGVLYCVGGRGDQGLPFSSNEYYNPMQKQWLPVVEMNHKRRHVGCVSANGKLYAIGGHDGKQHLNTGEVFDPKENRWSRIENMVYARRGISLAYIKGGPIYAIGGLDDRKCYKSVERYDTIRDKWSIVNPLLQPRGGVAVTTYSEEVYAVGGNDGTTSLVTCERYNPLMDKWINISCLSQRRAGAGLTVLDDKIYVIGGFDESAPLNSVECYCPLLNKWTTKASLLSPRGGVGAATLAGRIFAVGGHDGKEYLRTVEVYDPETDSWSYDSDVSTCRAGAGICYLDCIVNDIVKCKKEIISHKTLCRAVNLC